MIDDSVRGERIGFALLIAVVLWAPIPLGSNRPWSLALLACVIALLAGAVLLANVSRVDAMRERIVPAGVCLCALTAWALLAFVQLLPMPTSLLALLSPRALERWQSVSDAGVAPISLDPGATLLAGLESLMYVALALLVMLLVNSWRRALALAVAIVAAGTLQALLGIAAALALEHGWLLRGVVHGVGGVSGTFVNPNHFAGFLEMAIAMSIGLALLPQTTRAASTFRSNAAAAIDWLMSRRAALVAAQVLMLSAVLWSGSRGALLALVVAVPIGLALVASRGAMRGALATMLSLSVALVVGVALWGPGTLVQKFEAQGFSANRAAVFEASLQAVRDYPLVGAGAGSYGHVLPAYKPATLDMRRYEHAHSDYLEELLERGFVGGALLALALGAALVRIAVGLLRRRTRRARALLAGTLIGAVALLVHGAYDFNLQIPANAAYFVVLLALGLKSSALPREV